MPHQRTTWVRWGWKYVPKTNALMFSRTEDPSAIGRRDTIPWFESVTAQVRGVRFGCRRNRSPRPRHDGVPERAPVHRGRWMFAEASQRWRGLPPFLAQVDCAHAYDRVLHSGVVVALLRRGMPPPLVGARMRDMRSTELVHEHEGGRHVPCWDVAARHMVELGGAFGAHKSTRAYSLGVHLRKMARDLLAQDSAWRSPPRGRRLAPIVSMGGTCASQQTLGRSLATAVGLRRRATMAVDRADPRAV